MGGVSEFLSAETVTSRPAMVKGLQLARGKMQQAGGDACTALAPAEPLSTCGFDGSPPRQRSLHRNDLFCEMVTWQWEELGGGNPREFATNNCNFDKKAKAGPGTNARKGGILSSREEL